MSKRNYNVFFNTHTVSGIVISVGLYVIFFAGAFALFMESIDHWESNERPHVLNVINYDKAISMAEAEGYNTHGRNFKIYGHEGHIVVRSPALTDSTLKKNDRALLPDSLASAAIFLELDKETYAKSEKGRAKPQKSLGNFLYELHYFEQIPVVGRYLAGLVSLFFLFAIITGIIVHWKKIISNFFTFRIKASIKNLWTDAHTALGTVGLPFQFMYALTGAILCILVVFSIPMEKVVYKGDAEALYNDIYPAFQDGHIELKGHNPETISINDQVQIALSEFSGEPVESVYSEIFNYQDKNAHLQTYIGPKKIEGVFNYANFVYRLADQKLVYHKPANVTPPYATAVWDFIHIIHYGNYGGSLVRVLYFILALITCVVIISGVMIWLTARDKKTYAHKVGFNRNVGAIYLGACLGLYPAIALLFLLTKTFPDDMEYRFEWISWLFLAFWIGYTLYSFFIKSNFKINRNSLHLAGIMGVLIPVFNGFHSGLWLWKSLKMGYVNSFFVDISWLVCGIVTLYVAFRIRPQKQRKMV